MKKLKKKKIQRKYNGNPLSYFRVHLEEFRKYETRTALFEGDGAMYKALARAGQLEEAIPKAKEYFVNLGKKIPGEGALSESMIVEIINSHYPCKGSSYRAAKKLHLSPTTVVKYWRKEGLKIRRVGCRIW